MSYSKTISDPIQGIAYCNHELAKLTARAAHVENLLQSVTDEEHYIELNRVLNTISYHKRAWTETLEKFIYQSHQLGLRKVSVTKAWANRKK